MKKLIYTRKELIGMLLVLFISFMFNQILIDNSYYMSISNKKKDVIDIVFVLLIFLIGQVTLDKSLGLWAKKLWQTSFLLFLLIFLCFILIDWYIYPYSTKNGQFRFGTIKQLITSPFYYLFLILIRSKFKTHN